MAAADAAPPLPQYDDFEETENHDGSFAPGDGTATGGGGNATRQVGEISKGRVCALALAALEASILPFPDARRLEKRLVEYQHPSPPPSARLRQLHRHPRHRHRRPHRCHPTVATRTVAATAVATASDAASSAATPAVATSSVAATADAAATSCSPSVPVSCGCATRPHQTRIYRNGRCSAAAPDRDRTRYTRRT